MGSHLEEMHHNFKHYKVILTPADHDCSDGAPFGLSVKGYVGLHVVQRGRLGVFLAIW